MFFRSIYSTSILLAIVVATSLAEDASTDDQRLAESQQFFVQSQQPTGLLIPLYHYPANVHTNAVFNRLIDLKKSYPTVPVCAIVNPANGPGTGKLDANYVKAIDRLRGAGVVLLGYVSTRFAAQPSKQVLLDIAAWRTRYPKVSGLFLDEMANKPDDATVQYYKQVTSAGHGAGFWPVFANPGTATPEPFFARSAADVFVIHENRIWPTDSPPWTRAVLIHSQKKFDRARFAMLRKHVRWLYVTHDVFDVKADPDDSNNNPWDELSEHLEESFRELSRQP
jgi:hypothetical protein